MVLSAGSLLSHATALSGAPVAIVQPIIMAGVVLAVPTRALLDLRRPSLPEAAAVTVTAGGLALFMMCVDTTTGDPSGHPWRQAAGITALVILTAGCWCLGGSGSWPGLGVRLAVVAGICFGITAVTLKSVAVVWTQQGAVAALTHWVTWSWLAAGLIGVATNQRSYRLAPLSMTLPVINIVNVVVAVGLGYLFFAEVPAGGVAALTGQAAGFALATAGLMLTARVLTKSGVGSVPSPPPTLTAKGA